MRIRVLIAALLVVSFGAGVGGAELPRVTELKDLHLDTALVSGGVPRAVIVAPADGRHAAAVRALGDRIRLVVGVALPVVQDTMDTERLLGDHNVVVLGNMSTSRFIEKLYQQWYTFLDLWYPGRGGYVLRTLHNPYGTGRNVIFLGGSDDAGVAKAVASFCDRLAPGRDLSVGRLMEISLGEGMAPPKVGETVHAWRDSYRALPNGRRWGYAPCEKFGWNPISVQAALYHMTGKREYMDEFKRLTFYAPGKAPGEIRKRVDTWKDLSRPFAPGGHYNAHLMPLIWDLIEESPLLTDAERLKVTDDIVAQQVRYMDVWPKYPGGTGRHGAYHALVFYAGSRYMAHSYPDPVWDQRMADVTKVFSRLLDPAKWGPGGSLFWQNTYMEPIFDFWMLAGPDAFAVSGTPRRMLSVLELIWQGREKEMSNRSQTINLMHKAARLLKDGRYIWWAQQPGYDFTVFRIGQSWWPGPELDVAPPTDLLGRISLCRSGGKAGDDGWYYFLSYRTTLDAGGDYFMFNGRDAGGRNAYHVNDLYYARLNGKPLVNGTHNQITLRRNGMVPGKVAKGARLVGSVAFGDVALIRSIVPNTCDAEWDRRLLWVGGRYAVVFDALTAHSNGNYEVSCTWGQFKKMSKLDLPGAAQTAGPPLATVVCSDPLRIALRADETQAVERWDGALEAGRGWSVANLLHIAPAKGQCVYTIARQSEHGFIVQGKEPAFFCSGPTRDGAVHSDAESAYVSPGRLLLFDGKRLAAGGVSIDSDQPVSVVWDFTSGRMHVQGATQTRLRIAPSTDGWRRDGQPVQRDAAGALRLSAGEHVLVSRPLAEQARVRLAAALSALRPLRARETWAVPGKAAQAEQVPAWKPAWSVRVSQEPVTHLSAAERSGAVAACAEDKNLVLLDDRGRVRRRIPQNSRILSLYMYTPTGGRPGPMVLVGLREDELAAYGPSGERLWRAKVEIAAEFMRGGVCLAEGWGDPKRGRKGVDSVAVADVTGTGVPEIVLGRPSTVEFRKLNGELITRHAVKWGDCSSLAFLRGSAKNPGTRILIGKYQTGNDKLSVFDAERKLLSDWMYGGLCKGMTQMSAWNQRGVSDLKVADLDADGAEEVVIVRTGHWNDIRVYDAVTEKCRWGRYFGPAESRPIWTGSDNRPKWDRHFMRGLVVADLDGDRKKELVVGMRNGWVCAFRANGDVLWTRRFDQAVTEGAAVGNTAAFGFADGTVRLFDGAGRTVRKAKLASAIGPMTTHGRNLIVGTANGTVAMLP